MKYQPFDEPDKAGVIHPVNIKEEDITHRVQPVGAPGDALLPRTLEGMNANDCAAFTHLHRAEMQVMVAYRIRMDTSTNWAVSMTSVLTVFALGNSQIHHSFFAFVLFMDVVFLVIEARRWSLFAFSRNRVLTLERGFFGRTLLGDVVDEDTRAPEAWPVAESWKVSLKMLMLAPTQHIEHVSWGALYLRFTRHYAYLGIGVYMGWAFKVYEQLGGGSSTTILLSTVAAVYAMIGILTFVFRPRDGGLALPGSVAYYNTTRS